MHPLKKLYCRTFQTAFKLVIPVLPYRKPKIIHQAAVVPKLLSKKKIGSVLIVTDAAVHQLGLIEPLKNALKENKINYVIYDKTVANPTIQNVEEARKLYLNNCCQGLIGFGGGSAMDFALIPPVALLDSSITKTLPVSVAATTGMDALTHAVEAYIGRSTTPSTRKDALKACELISANLTKACLDRENDKARENMLKAAFLAGNAFSKSYVGYCHAVAHSLGGRYNIPHGLANAVILPYTLKAYDKTIYKKSKDIAIAMKLADKNTPAKEAHESLIQWILDTNKTLGIPAKLSGIWEEDIPSLAKHADEEANPLYPVPVLMNAKELEQFYYDVME